MEDKHIKGSIGEINARNYLKSKGYEIIDANYHSIYGEIDIIAKSNKTLVFVEVKYRKNKNYGYPREAVGFRKQEKIRNTALIYIEQNNIVNTDFRFDVLEIIGDFKNIIQIENAF